MSKLDGQSNGKNDKDTSLEDFDAISQALYSNDHENLSRLMADKEAPEEEVEEELEEEVTEEEEADSTDDGIETKDDEDSSDDEDEEEEKPEAAPPAASTANKNDDAELHRLRSDAGRVPFLQRQLAELQRELRAQKARTSHEPADSPAGKPATTDLSQVVLDEETQKEIDELREVDPVLARTMERIAKTAIFTANSRADHVVDTFTKAEQEQEEHRFLMEQKSILAEKVPQHEQIFASPEWKQWKESLTPNHRAMAESSYANEVEQAIYAFAADMRRLQGGGVESPAAPHADSKIKKAREDKMSSSPEVKNPSAKKAKAFDPEAAYLEMYNQIAKDNHLLK